MLSVSHRRTGRPTSRRLRDSIEQGTSAGVYQLLVVYVQRITPRIYRWRAV